mmetsp:Transcript_18630/g.37669  ORF Transcript_18630/g.37669 Transcript_18630/m.37669 type:complete len:360 (+) Transcript_18630:192-1271(+)
MKTQKTKAKKNAILSKPKRPMSAYNFFFRDERNNILAEAQHGQRPKTFEEIGRIIGKRWREINDDELETYKDMAAKDTARYQEEMKLYYQDELNLMCLGHNTTDIGVKPHADQSNCWPWDGEQGTSGRSENIEGSACSDATKKNTSPPVIGPLEDDKNHPPMASFFENIFRMSNRGQQSSTDLHTNHRVFNTVQGADANQASLKSPTLSNDNNNQSLWNVRTSPQRSQYCVMENLHAQNSLLLKQVMAQKTLIEQQQEEIENLKKHSRMKDALLHRAMTIKDLKSGENDKPSVTAPVPMKTAAFRVHERAPPQTAAQGLSFGATNQYANAAAATTSNPKLSPADILSLMMLMGKGRGSR